MKPMNGVIGRAKMTVVAVVVALTLALLLALTGGALLATAKSQDAGSRNCFGEAPTIVGTNKADRLSGTSRPDVIVSLGGNDTIFGKSGSDRICGGGGEDGISGGEGDDRLDGDAEDDELHGLNGADRLLGGSGSDDLWGENHRDTLNGQDDDDRLQGEDGEDLLAGGTGDDGLFGMSDNDVVSGQEGRDFANGGEDDDIVSGGEGDDQGAWQVVGGPGDDQVEGGPGNDRVDGGSGVDSLNGENGDDLLIGDDGNDTLRGGDGSDEMRAGNGEDDCSGGANRDLCDGGRPGDPLENTLDDPDTCEAERKRSCHRTGALPARWQGSVSGTNVDGGLTETWSGTVRFDRLSCTSSISCNYSPTIGELTFRVSGVDTSGCSWSGGGSITVSAQTAHGNLGVTSHEDRTTYLLRNAWSYDTAGEHERYPATRSCPPPIGTTFVLKSPCQVWLEGGDFRTAPPDTNVLIGSYSETDTFGVACGDVEWGWNLEARS